ncbi:MAG TPA: flagellar hook capping FlgD N-terminal domain-containing protein [Verrucomicrobiae bacterium]|jgi:flagellar basal-body rod modification protein FlgD|nr:flagellar hook capping FlgD N-terminal domain-containing protein [Verrucomicrobiae bacterium]
MSSPINYINTSGPATSSGSGTGSQSLTQANFLQLLVTQMSSQDPLNPESDTDFAAQLAQFSSLQESQDMQSDLQNIQATGLIGQVVTVLPKTGGASVTGVVSSVQVAAGVPSIIVNNQPYGLNQISGVMSLAPAAASTGGTTTGGTTSRPTNPNSTTSS